MENENFDDYTIADIKNDILNMYSSPEYQKLNEYYGRQNIFEILKKSRDENAHSNFLAWFLDSSSGHSLGTTPMFYFLRLLDFAKIMPLNSSAHLPLCIEDIAIGNSNQIKNVKVIREEPLNVPEAIVEKKDADRRLDLFCTVSICNENGEEKDIFVVVENKIKSTENYYKNIDKYQTEIYYEYLLKKFETAADDIIFVYLTPKTTEELQSMTEQDCRCKKFIQINYQQILDYVIQPCRIADISQENKIFIDNYIRCLSSSPYDEDDIGRLNMMAIGLEEREMLKKFLENNNRLILAAIEAKISETEDKSERDSLIEGVNILRNDSKKHTYAFDNKNFSSMSATAYAVLSKYVESNKDVTLEELEKVFSGVKGDNSRLFKNTKELNETQKDDYRKEYIKLPSSNVEIAVTKHWSFNGKKTFKKFIEYVNEKLGKEYHIDVLDPV